MDERRAGSHTWEFSWVNLKYSGRKAQERHEKVKVQALPHLSSFLPNPGLCQSQGLKDLPPVTHTRREKGRRRGRKGAGNKPALANIPGMRCQVPDSFSWLDLGSRGLCSWNLSGNRCHGASLWHWDKLSLCHQPQSSPHTKKLHLWLHDFLFPALGALQEWLQQGWGPRGQLKADFPSQGSLR